MIYIDSSILIAQLLAEDRRPPASLWEGPLVSSRLLELETWIALHSRGQAGLREPLWFLLARLSILEMQETVLARALEPFPAPVRAVNAIHLASADYLRRIGEDISIATYDARMSATARKMEFEIVSLD
jgi:predicted nucleic acid-binding protein